MRWWLLLLASSALAQNSRDGMQASLEKQRQSIAKQREAARKQAELVNPPPLKMPEPGDGEPLCDPIPDTTVTALIDGAAQANSLQPDVLRAVIRQESRFYPCAVSSKGAEGLMQLMPEVIRQFSVADPFDPKQSLDAGAKYLKQLFDRYNGDLSKTLAAYNAGPTAVDEAKGIPDIVETKDYVQAILQMLAGAKHDAAPAEIKPPVPPRAPTPTPIGN